MTFGVFVLFLVCLKIQNGQPRSEEEDETVDVESYGDETASSAMNLAASQNNNNITKIDSIRPTMRLGPFTSSSSMPIEDHMITSRNSIWQQHTKHGQHRIGASPPVMGTTNINIPTSIASMNCGPPAMFSSETSGATSTSNDQVNEYDRSSAESPNRGAIDRMNVRFAEIPKNCSRENLKSSVETTRNNCDNDNDEEVIVTNDDDECTKKMPSTKDPKRNDKNRYY